MDYPTLTRSLIWAMTCPGSSGSNTCLQGIAMTPGSGRRGSQGDGSSRRLQLVTRSAISFSLLIKLQEWVFLGEVIRQFSWFSLLYGNLLDRQGWPGTFFSSLSFHFVTELRTAHGGGGGAEVVVPPPPGTQAHEPWTRGPRSRGVWPRPLPSPGLCSQSSVSHPGSLHETAL